MKHLIPLGQDNDLILAMNDASYQEVIHDFENSDYIKISTYNISANRNDLIDKLRALSSSVKITLVTNIPSRFEKYYGDSFRETANKNIKNYLIKLSPQNIHPKAEVYFNYSNHSKIIISRNLAYIGSSNFSDESSKNIECGIIIRDKDIIQKMEKEFFDPIMTLSTRYYGSPLSECHIELSSIIKVLLDLKVSIFNTNQKAIDNITYESHNYIPLQFTSNELENLFYATLNTDDLINDYKTLFSAKYFESVILAIKEDGSKLRTFCSIESHTYNLSTFNVDEQTSAKFENMGHLDSGENTDDILLRAQEEALEECNDLQEAVQDDIPAFKFTMQSYVDNYSEMINLITKMIDSDQLINNT